MEGVQVELIEIKTGDLSKDMAVDLLFKIWSRLKIAFAANKKINYFFCSGYSMQPKDYFTTEAYEDFADFEKTSLDLSTYIISKIRNMNSRKDNYKLNKASISAILEIYVNTLEVISMADSKEIQKHWEVYCENLKYQDEFEKDASIKIKAAEKALKNPKTAANIKWKGQSEKYEEGLRLIEKKVNIADVSRWKHNGYVRWLFEVYEDDEGKNPFKTIRDDEGSVIFQGIDRKKFSKMVADMFRNKLGMPDRVLGGDGKAKK